MHFLGPQRPCVNLCSSLYTSLVVAVMQILALLLTFLVSSQTGYLWSLLFLSVELRWFVPIFSWSNSSNWFPCNCCIRGCHLCFWVSVWVYFSSSYLGYHLPLFVALCSSKVQASALLPPLSLLSVNHPVHMPCFFPSLTVVSLSQGRLPMVSALAVGLSDQAIPFHVLHSVVSQRILSISPWSRLHQSE